jgi:hypothetical protein
MEHVLTEQLQRMLIDQAQCQSEQDLQGVLQLIHRESFSYNPTQQWLMKLFASYQLRFSLIGHKLLAVDGDYAFVRCQLKSESMDAPEFSNKITDSIVIFRKLNEQWKIWCQAPIDFHAI